MVLRFARMVIDVAGTTKEIISSNIICILFGCIVLRRSSGTRKEGTREY